MLDAANNAYQRSSTGTTPSPIRVVDFQLEWTAAVAAELAEMIPAGRHEPPEAFDARADQPVRSAQIDISEATEEQVTSKAIEARFADFEAFIIAKPIP